MACPQVIHREKYPFKTECKLENTKAEPHLTPGAKFQNLYRGPLRRAAYETR